MYAIVPMGGCQYLLIPGSRCNPPHHVYAALRAVHTLIQAFYIHIKAINMTSNKYNRSRSFGSEKRSIIQYFSIKQFRFDTSSHPVIQSKEKCSASLKAVISHQERQTIEGLVNTLECSERQALRICIHEFLASVKVIPEQDIECAKSGSSKKGHEGRETQLKLQLPSSEKKGFKEACEKFGLKEGELLRLTFIWLRNQIRVNDLARLDSSSRRSQIELFRKWSSTHDGSPSKLTSLREASQEAWDQAEERAFNRYLEKEQQKKLRRLYKAVNKYADNNEIDALIQLDAQRLDPFESEIQQLLNAGKIDDREAEVRRLMYHLCLSRTDAEAALDSEDESQFTDDELELMVCLFLEELHQERISDWLDTCYDGDWRSLESSEVNTLRANAEAEMKAELERRTIPIKSRGRSLGQTPGERRLSRLIGKYFNTFLHKPDQG